MLQLPGRHQVHWLYGGVKNVNTIICDPPYFLGMTHDGQSAQAADLAICVPFYRELFREFRRVLAPDGCIYWFCDWRSYAFYFGLFEDIKPRNLLVWDKGSGCGNFYTNEHELIIFSTLNTRFQTKVHGISSGEYRLSTAGPKNKRGKSASNAETCGTDRKADT